MGLSIDREEFDDGDYAAFAERLKENLIALKALLAQPGFGEGPTTLGAELELSIVDESGYAFPINRAVLARNFDPHLQLELDRFNLEYNLDSVIASGRPFSVIEAEMTRALEGIQKNVAELKGRIVTVGILPTIREQDLQPSAMTDLPRYRVLSKSIARLRQAPFEIKIDGENEAIAMQFGDVTLEGAGTSFQIHLRVNPADFSAIYNAAQLATPFAVALGANSPLFLERLLWEETRVALFKQSVDGRDPNATNWERPARVSFGSGWVRRGAFEQFAESVAIFPPLIPLLGQEKSLETIREGGIPELEELRLHHGTVWQWNRAIYDPTLGGHLRIEMRALPSGPTALDMSANAAWLLGLTFGLRGFVEKLLPSFPFRYAEDNFYEAARYGINAELLWPSLALSSLRKSNVRELAYELLPVAEQGLAELGVEDTEARRFLEVIRGRLESQMNGAKWQRQVVCSSALPRSEALTRMLEAYLQHSAEGRPVHEWSDTI